MPKPADAVVNAIIGASSVITRRCDIYEQDAETPWHLDAPIIDGTVGVDQSRSERRTFDITLDNDGGAFDNYPGGFWYDKIVKLFRGVRLSDGTTWETQIGEFVIDAIERPHFPEVARATGRDYTKRLLKSKLPAATNFPEGSAVEDVVRTLAVNGGIRKMIIPSTGERFGKDYLFERCTERWKAINDIATSFGYGVYFDAFGNLVMSEHNDPVTSPHSWTFRTGVTGTIASYNKASSDDRLYNHIVVTGQAADLPPVFAEAINDTPGSPTNRDEIGDRVYEYVSPFITEYNQALNVANNFLSIHALESFDLSLEAVVLPWLDAGEIVEFEDPDPSPGEPTRFLLSSFDLPLRLGTMRANAKRVTIVR